MMTMMMTTMAMYAHAQHCADDYHVDVRARRMMGIRMVVMATRRTMAMMMVTSRVRFVIAMAMVTTVTATKLTSAMINHMTSMMMSDIVVSCLLPPAFAGAPVATDWGDHG